MTPRRRALAGSAAGVAALAAVIGIGVLVEQATPRAVEVGVTVYEDANQTGDRMLTSGIAPNLPRRANLGLVTTGLHGGCNRGINQSSSWNDCISSASVGLLPANTKVQFWRDINYGGGLLACYDVDGSHAIDLSGTGDLISSFRVISGNC